MTRTLAFALIALTVTASLAVASGSADHYAIRMALILMMYSMSH
ncbi:MAG TPA: hypothetical protein VFY29_12715 [Terriglobia bacterium]|nr:hypothetical protein [Terriglobia bacterium]